MILIIGGAYQGKLEYVKERFAIKEEDIFSCQKSEIDFENLKVSASLALMYLI